VDFQGDYDADMSDLGLRASCSLTFRLVGTLTTTSKSITFPGQPAFDCSGLFGNTCGSPLVEIASSVPHYLGSGVKLDNNTLRPGLTNGSFDKLNAAIPDVSYLDLSGSWQFYEHLEIRAGSDNVFDTDPKIISNRKRNTQRLQHL